ncbi:MAG: KamA family protein [Bacteroidales bacterium]|nr:KamA family protein [Bacteroidales bacterium]
MASNTLSKFKKNLPEIYRMAVDSETEEEFCGKILEYTLSLSKQSNDQEVIESASLINRMLGYESQFIDELSKGERIYLETFSILWNYLNNNTPDGSVDDFAEDVYQIFLRTVPGKSSPQYSESRLLKQMKRWPGGLDIEVIQKRQENKKRIIALLVKKIEKRSAQQGRFHFEDGLNKEQKIKQVNEWWNDFRFHLIMAIKSPGELNTFLGESLSTKTMRMLNKAKNKKIPFFVTPYYLSLLNTDEAGYDDYTIRTYILYSQSLVDTYGNIKAWEREDEVVPGKPNAAGWLLPEGHNIHRRYPEVAIMIPDTRGRSCGGLCASCQRMYDFQSERLNFDMDSLKPKESWDRKLIKLMEFFENDSQLRDILITGGDALMSRNKVLENILDAVLKMAQRKKLSNLSRADGEKYFEIQRVRLGTRLLAYLPMRVDSELISILSDFRKKGINAGIRQFVIQTHFQSPLEITPEAKHTIEAILSAGWTISNQLVFTAAASRRGHTARLRQALNSLGVVTYYTFTVKGFEENMEMFAPNSRSIQEQREEKIFGKMSPSMQTELNQIFDNGEDIKHNLKRFMKMHQLPFLPTDRNVLNLPAIGKSMTFQMVGITKDGKRVLKFDHDRTREHSPVIDKMGEVFIIENRSVNSYLRELESMGEKVSDYESIWRYTSGETEQVFPLFDYPDCGFTPTKSITNFMSTE